MKLLLDWIDELIQKIKDFFIDTLSDFVKWNLNQTHDLFSHSINTVHDQVNQTPKEFSETLVNTLNIISDSAVLPVAGLILAYAFCYELYLFVTEKNRGFEVDMSQLLWIILKTGLVIILCSNSFDISMAFFDLGKWMTQVIPNAALKMPTDITESITNSINDVGSALGMAGLSVIVLIVTFFMSGIIYLVAWSRIITIMLFVSVAPIPFATLMNRDWVGSIGQNYLKQLLALMLQGFFMLVCLVIYAGLLDKTVDLITAQNRPIFGLMLLLVSMGILTLTLTRTHSLAKSVVGVF